MQAPATTRLPTTRLRRGFPELARRSLAEAASPRITIPHYSFPANSVGVLPVTCRKAWENAGTLA